MWSTSREGVACDDRRVLRLDPALAASLPAALVRECISTNARDRGSRRVEVVVQVVPIWCSGCARQLPWLYRYPGGRYGQVGTLRCPCRATIWVTDRDDMGNDLMLTNSNGPRVEFHPEVLYRLRTLDFSEVRERSGFDLLVAHPDPNEWIELDELTAEIAAAAGIGPFTSRATAPDPWKHLPPSVATWLTLLRRLGVPAEHAERATGLSTE